MKRILSFILALLLVFGLCVFAGNAVQPQFTDADAQMLLAGSTVIENSKVEKVGEGAKDTKDEINKNVEVAKEKVQDLSASGLQKMQTKSSEEQVKLGKDEQLAKDVKELDKNMAILSKTDKSNTTEKTSNEEVAQRNLNITDNVASESDKTGDVASDSAITEKKVDSKLEKKINNAKPKRKKIGRVGKKTFNDDASVEKSGAQPADYQLDLQAEKMELCIIGKASKNVSPDSAKVTAVIETLDSDIVKSKDNNFQVFDKVVNALKGAGLSDDKIVMDSFVSYPSYDYNGGKSLTGYYTITTISFDVDNIEEIKNLVDIVTENGATSIRNIQYCCSNLDEIYEEVLMMAIDNAKAKAEKIGGGQLQIKSVKEEYVYSCSSLYRTYAENISNSLVGSIEVEARVNVEFEGV